MMAEQATLGRTVSIKGRVTGSGDLSVAGTIDGDIAIGGELRIVEGGRAAGRVEATDVLVEGELKGEIRTPGVIHVGSVGRIEGDVQAASFFMDEGAIVAATIHCAFELPPELEEPTK